MPANGAIESKENETVNIIRLVNLLVELFKLLQGVTHDLDRALDRSPRLRVSLQT